ncbi:hypothetical protein BGZ79_001738, partial [Entomortierella chlamydospora]
LSFFRCIEKPSKDMSEDELVAVWKYVLRALSGRTITMRSYVYNQHLCIQTEYDIDLGTATYGRKLDLQCRADLWEINNSEFKAHSTATSQVDIQYRKNLRVNQSMALYLNNQLKIPLIELEMLGLDIHGLVGIVFSLKYQDSIFVSDLASHHAMRLPDSEAAWRSFLNGQTISVLLNYLEHLHDLKESVLEKALEREENIRTVAPRTPNRSPILRPIGGYTLFSPSKKQKVVLLSPDDVALVSPDDVAPSSPDDGIEDSLDEEDEDVF